MKEKIKKISNSLKNPLWIIVILLIVIIFLLWGFSQKVKRTNSYLFEIDGDLGTIYGRIGFKPSAREIEHKTLEDKLGDIQSELQKIYYILTK